MGIKDLRDPVVVMDRQKESQHTVATINMFVRLPHRFKGSHMSRFVEILNHCRGKVSVHEIGDVLRTMNDRFECETSHLEIRFPYFMEKVAPASGAKSFI